MRRVTEAFVRESVVRWLQRHGYTANMTVAKEYQPGIDIFACHQKRGDCLLIEAKGDTDPESKRASGRRLHKARHVLGQILMRIHPNEENGYAIAVPETFRSIFARNLPWQVCRDLNLSILYVRPNGNVDHWDWRRMREGVQDQT